MKFQTDWDTVGFETDPGDTDLLRAARDTVHGIRDIAEHVGLSGTGSCDNCNTHDRLRPYPLSTDTGELNVVDLCPDCQVGFVERIKQAQGESDGEVQTRDGGGASR